MLQGTTSFQEFAMTIFNQTGASLQHAVNATLDLDDLPANATWEAIQPKLVKRIDDLRNPAIDPNALRLQPDKMHLTMTGPIDALTRAISRKATTPVDDLPILQSVLVINSASGEGFAPGNGHQLHLPFRVTRKNYPSEPLPEPGHFPDVLGAVVRGVGADFLEVVNQSNLPAEDDIAAYAHEKIKMAGAGLLVVGINVDAIVGVKEDCSTAYCKGTNQGSESNTSVQKSDTHTTSEGRSESKDTGYGTNKSYNSGTTSGWNQGSGGGTQIGLMWDTDSTSFQDGTHSDVTTGSSHGFDRHTSWNESVSNDKSRAVGITMTEGSSISTGSSEQRTVTNTQSFEDNAILRRLTTLIVELQHAKNVVVAVISSREDMFTLKSIVRTLGIKPPMRCALCQYRIHDPTCLLHGHTAVPCCTHCFSHAPHNIGIRFDDGESYDNVNAALNELSPVIHLVEEVECCSVEGHWATRDSPRTIQQAILASAPRLPSLQHITLCAFGDALPTVAGVIVTRRPPEILNRIEFLRPHCDAFGLPCERLEGSIASTVSEQPDVNIHQPSTPPPRPTRPAEEVNAMLRESVNMAPGAPALNHSVGACLNALLPIIAPRIRSMALRLGLTEHLHRLLNAPATDDIMDAICSDRTFCNVDAVDVPTVLMRLIMGICDVKKAFEVRRVGGTTEYSLALLPLANQSVHLVSTLIGQTLQHTSNYLCIGFQRFNQGSVVGRVRQQSPTWNGREVHYSDELSVPLVPSSSSAATVSSTYQLKSVITQSTPTDVRIYISPQQGDISWRCVDTNGTTARCSATEYKRQTATVVALIYERT